MNLKKFGKLFTKKFVGTGPSSYKKRIYRAAVSQRLRNAGLLHVAVHIAVKYNVLEFLFTSNDYIEKPPPPPRAPPTVHIR